MCACRAPPLKEMHDVVDDTPCVAAAGRPPDKMRQSNPLAAPVVASAEPGANQIRICRINVKPWNQKYSAGHVGQITGMSRGILGPHEGRFAIVTMRWAEGAMDALVQVRANAQTTERRRTAKSCGPGAAMLASSRQQGLLPMTVTTSPLTGESAI
jgi:hypothetical protein